MKTDGDQKKKKAGHSSFSPRFFKLLVLHFKRIDYLKKTVNVVDIRRLRVEGIEHMQKHIQPLF